jgi:uncharacterized membrane protein
MSRDNVTPFRPRRPPPRPKSKGLGLTTHRGKAVLAQLLTLICFAASFLLPSPPWSYIGLAIGVAGVAIAASNRYDAMPWAKTHHEHVLRTIIIGAAIWTLGSLLLMFPLTGAATIWVYLVVLVWVAIRAGIGLVLAVLRKPIPHPKGILI